MHSQMNPVRTHTFCCFKVPPYNQIRKNPLSSRVSWVSHSSLFTRDDLNFVVTPSLSHWYGFYISLYLNRTRREREGRVCNEVKIYQYVRLCSAGLALSFSFLFEPNLFGVARGIGPGISNWIEPASSEMCSLLHLFSHTTVWYSVISASPSGSACLYILNTV